MSRLDPDKLTVEYREGVTETAPIIPRRYTLTHSDITADLFLTIGLSFAFDKVDAVMRDEVLGEWLIEEESLRYYVYLHVDGQIGQGLTEIRNFIFRRELPLALEAIRYGDRQLFAIHPELDQSPIIVFFLSESPEFNSVENWGTFADYTITGTNDNTVVNSMAEITTEYHVLIDEKIGDVTGDGIPDRICLYGDKSIDSPYISNLRLEIEDGQTGLTLDIITEVSGYNPTLFLGDFTNDNIDEIKLSMETGGSGGYGTFVVYSYSNNEFKTLFESGRYNIEYQYLVEYNDFYSVSVGNVMVNKLFFLDLKHKGYEYVSRYYKESGELIKPVIGEVLALGALLPIIDSENDNSFQLLAFQRIIGSTNSDTLGYIENLLGWNGERFTTVRMMATTPGTDLT
jgi:hypothetical protein